VVSALLLNWFELGAEDVPDFEFWHTREHMIERLDVPGFRLARRYEAFGAGSDGVRRFLVGYGLTDIGVLTSADYLARLDNPTPLTQRMVPRIRTMTRTAFDVVAHRGRGVGRHLSTFRLDGVWAESADAGAVNALLSEVFEQYPAVSSLCIGRPDAQATHAKDLTAEGRATRTVVPPSYQAIALVESADRAAGTAAAEAFASGCASEIGGEVESLQTFELRLVMDVAADATST
jgi:hypothetical protein